MTFSPIADRRVYQQVAGQIARKLDAGDYQPGERLPAERMLADLFHVSRSSIREALIVLETRKRIEVRGGSGVFVLEHGVASPAAADFSARMGNGPLDVLLARKLLEPEIAALAAQHICDSHIDVLHQTLGKMVCCQQITANFLEYDRQFHLQLAEASGNNALYRSVEILWGFRIGPGQLHADEAFSPDAWQLAIAEHRDIMIAVSQRDAALARTAMSNHLKQVRSRLSTLDIVERQS